MTSIIKNHDHYYERTKAIVILALQKTKKGTRKTSLAITVLVVEHT